MANDTKKGAEKLKERILLDAQADADATLKQAEALCDEIRTAADKDSELTMQALKKQREESVHAILERSRTNAELAARKRALEKRRAVLDQVFDEAYTKLCALDSTALIEVYRNIVLREAEGGEIILPAAKDRDLIAGELKSFNDALSEKGIAPLSLSAEDTAEAERGFALLGKGFEKDCSLRALLRDARANEETHVAGILFD